MFQEGFFDYAEEAGGQWIALPYAAPQLSMIIMLPKRRLFWPVGEEKLVNRLVTRPPKWTTTNVRVWLPRFKLQQSVELNDRLRALGVRDAFSRQRANFRRIDGKSASENGVFVSTAIHRAVIEVNEDGSEAAAATAISMDKSVGMSEPPKTFRADHPFAFAIVEANTRAVLFVGRVVDPAP